MVIGETDYIECLGLNNYPVKATAGDTNVSVPGGLFLQSTTDPDWHFYNPVDNSPGGQAEWLEFLEGDGSHWKAKIRCTYKDETPGYIDAWFELKRTNGEDAQDHHSFVYLDWERQRCRVHIKRVDKPFPNHPRFFVERVP